MRAVIGATTTPRLSSTLRCRLVYDESGLVLDYPGIAVRAF